MKQAYWRKIVWASVMVYMLCIIYETLSPAAVTEDQILLIKAELHIDYLEQYIEDNHLPTPAREQ